eukprot:4858403-Prorocentrum_lima.AAC.1
MGVDTAIQMASKAAPLMRTMIKIVPGVRMNYTTFYAEVGKLRPYLLGSTQVASMAMNGLEFTILLRTDDDRPELQNVLRTAIQTQGA